MTNIILGKTNQNKSSNPVPAIKRAAFILSTSNVANIKPLSSSPPYHLYPFVKDNGSIGSIALLAKELPLDTIDQDVFSELSDLKFTIEYPEAENLKPEIMHLVEETLLYLKGSRLSPTRMEVTKVTPLDTGKVYVEGNLENAIDPRLEFLDSTETTLFGSGQFDPSLVKAHYDGNFAYLKTSAWSEDIKRIAKEQEKVFEDLQTAIEEGSEPKKEILEKELERLQNLLKPHANQVYDINKDHIYHISGAGNWRCNKYAGLRDLDIYDRQRIGEHFKKGGLEEVDLSGNRASLHSFPIYDRFHHTMLASALEPIVKGMKESDLKELQKIKDKNLKLTPLDGPLGAKDLPGLKPGTKFFPHQSYILAYLKDSSRQLTDADGGAGKTLLIICDILHQMKMGRLKKPLIVMPEYLLAQFALEVKNFSELNPWIINTESIAKWSHGDDEFEAFLEDAKNAPPNTIFLTSYNWLGRVKEEIKNGTVRSRLDKDTNKTVDAYGTSEFYPRPNRLKTDLGIDSLYMDEIHCLKNESNQSYATVSLGDLPIVRGFTGTIMPGNLIDITGPMGVIHSGVFGSADDFLADYSENGTPNLYSESAPKEIRKKLKEFGTPQIRRSAWQHLLPKSHEESHYVKFSKPQQKTYDALLTTILDEIRADPKLSKSLKKLEQELKESGGDGEQLEITGPLLSRFIPLEIFVNSPTHSATWIKSLLSDEDAISPKAKVISEICRNHLANPNNGKVLIFVQYKESGKGILETLDPDVKEMADYYEGGMIDVLTRFKNPQDPLKILIGVDRTLRIGQNIQVANCVIHADLLWMNGDMHQREARAIRIGQLRDVYVHYILTTGSSEILKMARLVSAEHMVAKANSDFEDKEVLQPVEMSLENMKDFRQEEQLIPFTERKKEIKAQYLKSSEEEKKFYGEKLLEPHGHESIEEVFSDAKILKRVPSSKTFIGDSRNIELLVEKELEKLPEEPTHPKLLEFHLKNWNGEWVIACYYTSDPQGFLRRLQFLLARTYWYLETGNKQGAMSVLERIEDKGFDIVDKEELLDSIREMRVTNPGVKNLINKTEKASRQRTRKKVAAAVRGEVALKFGMFDGNPALYADSLEENDEEMKVLKAVGFRSEPSFWYRLTTRSQIVRLFTRIQQQYPDIRLTGWDNFKTRTNQAFRGLDLSGFDELQAIQERKK